MKKYKSISYEQNAVIQKYARKLNEKRIFLPDNVFCFFVVPFFAVALGFIIGCFVFAQNCFSDGFIEFLWREGLLVLCCYVIVALFTYFIEYLKDIKYLRRVNGELKSIAKEYKKYGSKSELVKQAKIARKKIVATERREKANTAKNASRSKADEELSQILSETRDIIRNGNRPKSTVKSYDVYDENGRRIGEIKDWNHKE